VCESLQVMNPVTQAMLYGYAIYYVNSRTGKTILLDWRNVMAEPEHYVILLHPEGELSFIARKSFTSLTAAGDHLNDELKKHKNLQSGRIYQLKAGVYPGDTPGYTTRELIKIMDICREVITRVTYHVQNTKGVI
jgi:hypothetical protein